MFDRVSDSIARHYSPRLMVVLLLATAGFFWLFNSPALRLSNPELVNLSGAWPLRH